MLLRCNSIVPHLYSYGYYELHSFDKTLREGIVKLSFQYTLISEIEIRNKTNNIPIS